MILGIIPARGGSKGIPRKNLYPLLGKPLIAYSIEAAQQSTALDAFIVSTEDDEIDKVSRQYGATVMYRPDHLAQDKSTTIDVLKYVTTMMPNYDTIVVLQPTSPIRNGVLIDLCVKMFKDSDCDTLATGFRSYQYKWGTMANEPRQEMDGFFYDDGNVYVHRADHLRRGEWWGRNRKAFEVDKQYNLEIDTMVDMWMAEGILRCL